MEMAVQKLNKPIEYQGLHFVGAQNYPSQMISEKEFEDQWQELASQAKKINLIELNGS